MVGISIAGGLLYYVYRDTSWEKLVNDMSQADPFWLAMGGISLLGVFIFRALRWQMMLHSSGYPAKTFTTTLAVLILYMVNSITPKIGEVARCTVLYKTDKVPVSAGLGTVFTERVIDALVLFAGVGIIFLLEIERLGNLFQQILANLSSMLGGNSTMLIVVAVIGLIIGAIGLYWFIQKGNNKGEEEDKSISGKLHAFAAQMLQGAKSVFTLKKPWLFLLYTAFIWITLVLMNYFFLRALPETAELGLYFAMLILFIGGLGWALPVPGGMGTTHFIILQMFLAFELSESAGKNIALLSNGATFIFSILYGLIALGLLFYLVIDRSGSTLQESPE